ncbi:MAG: MFS transporter [Anaerolineae bacterium]|nr:MFS transporter [Anaerolineae bacterium]
MQKAILKNYRFNFTVNVLDGAFFGLGLGFASFVTIIPLFVASLTDSTTVIGLIASIHLVGWQLPQVLTSNRVAGLRLYRPMVMRMTLHERWPFLGLAVVAVLIPTLGVPAALIFTVVLLAWQALGGGFTATAWQAMIGKVMPENRRGFFYGAQSSGISLLTGFGAIGAGIILTQVAYPYNFALCFFIAVVAMTLSFIFLWLTREPESPPVETHRSRKLVWDNLWAILKRDGNFRWFLLSRMLTQFAVMAVSFYTIYAVRHFNLGAETAGFMTGLMSFAQMIGSPLVGWVGDRWGHRRMFAAGMLLMALSIAVALMAPTLEWFYLVFALAGLTNGVLWTSVLTLTVEFGAEIERPYYIGLANTLVAPATLIAPMIGGALVDLVNFQATFILALVAALLAVGVLMVVLRDPRTLRTAEGSLVAAGVSE